MSFKHFALPSNFFRNLNEPKKTFPAYKGFLNYKFKNLKIRSAFIFNDNFPINKSYSSNFVYHNLFGFFRDYFS